jgi:hypothetical protein
MALNGPAKLAPSCLLSEADRKSFERLAGGINAVDLED